MELQEAIRNRRTIRSFSDEEVPAETIKQLMEAARFAPSWANTQCWEFIAVVDRQLIKKVTDCYSEANRARLCSEQARLVLVGYAKQKLAGYRKGENATKFSEWFMYDLASAVQNISLTAHELGLGTVIVGLMDHDRLRTLLEIPAEYEVVVALPVGKPSIPNPEPPKRKEISEFVYRNKYGQSF